MKKILIVLNMLIVAVGIPLNGKGDIYLRVIADSDTTVALERKIEIKDMTLSLFAQDKSKSFQALHIFRNELFETDVLHFSYRMWSPGGIHQSCPTLVCTIGSGRGHNWWGILYDDVQTWDIFLYGLLLMDNGESNSFLSEKDRSLNWPILYYLLNLI